MNRELEFYRYNIVELLSINNKSQNITLLPESKIKKCKISIMNRRALTRKWETGS